jgi:septal ring factor EnvC (AmiA/AmiB activator)
MARFFLIFIVLCISIHAANDLDKKIRSQKSSLVKQKNAKKETTSKIRTLARQINTQNKELNKLEKEIAIVNADILKNKKLLATSENELSLLNITSKDLVQKKIDSEDQLIELIIQDYSSSQAIKLANENSLNELMNNEVYEVISKHTKDEILKINNQYMRVVQDKKSNEKNVKQLSSYIKKREKKKKILSSLKNKHSKSLQKLEGRHKEYQAVLKKIIQKQKSMSDLLGRLNILKKAKLKKEKIRQAKEKKRLAALKKKQQQKARSSKETQSQVQARNAKKIDLDVRMLGSSTKGVKISKYRGGKTIAPLKSYRIIKRFGKYFDPVYKIKLFNESVVLRSKKRRAKVYSVLKGKVVYAKQNSGMLENVVIVQHRNGLHTIYSHLDQISPTLRVGKWIKKGYVVGRVNETLTFQATKNNSHINPEELFR